MNRVLALFAGLTLLASCEPAKPKAEKTIGVSLLTRQHDFYKDLEAGLVEEAAKNGFKLNIQAGEFDASKQANQIENFIVQKVDAIIVCPCDSSAVGSVLDKAEKAGIPVFTADISAAKGKVVCHVASDNVQGGRLAAKEMSKYVKDGDKVFIIDHPVVASVQDRTKGFIEELKKIYPNIQITAQPGEGKRDKAMQVMESVISKEFKGVFGINDDSALGALSALKAAGKTDVAIIGYDATPEARKAITGGTCLKADVIQKPTLIGTTTIQMISKFFKGETVPAIVPVEVGIFDGK